MSFWRGILNLIVALEHSVLSPGLWAFVALLAVAVWAAFDYASGLTPVTLVIDSVPRQVRTRCATVGEVLDDVGVVVGERDRVVPDHDALVRARMTIAVQHARLVTVVADGMTQAVYTHHRTADEILLGAGIDLRPGDRLRVNGQWVVGEQDVQLVDPKASDRSSGQWTAPVRAGFSRGGRSYKDLSPELRIEVQRAIVVYLSDGDVEQTLRTTAKTVGRALAEAKILLYLGDRIYPGLNTPVTAGLRVRIQRGVPVSVAVDGRTVRARTHRKSVGEVLAELDVSLVGRDFVQPPMDTEVEEGLHIQAIRFAERTIIEQEEIPFQTEWIPDPSLELDHRRVDDVGAIGITRRRYKAVYHDGQEVERYLEDQWVAQEPRSRQISYGTRIVIRTLDTLDGPIEYWRRIRVFLTSYTAATCGKTMDHPQYGITRLGWKMRYGIVAVDPRVIRLRSELYVPSYGRGIAGDTGGMINGRHIDLGFDEDNYVMYYWWGYVYVLTPVPQPGQIRWILPDFPRER